MWPFKKKNVNADRTPWDDLIDYLQSDDVKFDHKTSNCFDVRIIYNDKTIQMNVGYEFGVHFSLFYENDFINKFLGKRLHKVCKKLYAKYKAECDKNLEHKLFCNLFDKCNES